MLTKIVHNSPKLRAFLDPLIESLSEPQRQHLRDFCDAILVCEGEHTIANLERQFVETTDPSNWADFLRIAPWDAESVRAELLQSQINWIIEQAEKSGNAKVIYLNLDDSLGEKDKATFRLDPVDIHHDHTESRPKQPRYKNGFVYLLCTMCVGDTTVTLATELYLPCADRARDQSSSRGRRTVAFSQQEHHRPPAAATNRDAAPRRLGSGGAIR